MSVMLAVGVVFNAILQAGSDALEDGAMDEAEDSVTEDIGSLDDRLGEFLDAYGL